jgi:hypothetical protein
LDRQLQEAEPKSKGLRGRVPGHQGLGEEIQHHPTLGEERPAQPCRCYLWAFSAINASPRANAHYRRRRQAGDWHAAAQRNLFNRMLGQLYHCLQTHELFEEGVAFPTQLLDAA